MREFDSWNLCNLENLAFEGSKAVGSPLAGCSLKRTAGCAWKCRKTRQL